MKSTFPVMALSASSTLKKHQKPKRVKPSHPRTADMVNTAIKSLKERGGSSLQAIKKYISSTYKVDAEKQAPFIKRYLKSAVATGGLVQIKGKGAAGSFKLPVSSEKIKTKKVAKTAPLKKSAIAVKSVKKMAAKPKKVVKKIAKAPAAKAPKVKVVAKKTKAKPVKRIAKKTAKVGNKTGKKNIGGRKK